MKTQNWINSYFSLLVIILIMFISAGANAANECKLKFKSNNSSFQTKNTNKGQSIPFVRSNFTDANNVGRNDMELTLEYFDIPTQRNKTEKLYLIKSGPLTLYLPPIPLIGKKLKRIRCKNYATVIDAQAYIRQFGQSANTLVTNATSEVTSAVTNAANNAANSFSSQTANSLKSAAQGAISQLNTSFNQAKSAANTAASNVRANLANNFPEVQAAVNASNSYAWSISNAAVAQGNQNIEKTLVELKRIDKKYKVSQTASNLLKVNMAKDFPEINALLTQQCDYDNRTFGKLKDDYRNIQNKMKVLDKKYSLSKNAASLAQALITIPKTDMRKIEQFMKFKQCDQNWEKFTVQFEKDRKAYSKYSGKLVKELKQFDKRVLTSSQRQFAVEIDRLIKASVALDKEQKAQEKREEDLFAAKKAHLNALEKVENDIGPMGDYFRTLPGGEVIVGAISGELKSKLPPWMTRDPARLKANLEDAKRKGEAYEKATLAYDGGFDKVERKYNLWTKQIGTTLKQGTRLKVKLPNGSPLWKLLKSVPKFNSISRGFTAMVSCVTDFVNLSGAAFDVFANSLGQYIRNIRRVMDMALPKDVRKALVDIRSALQELNSTAFAQFSDKDISATMQALDKNATSVGNLMKQIHNNANVSNQINSALKLSEKQWREALAAAKSVSSKFKTVEGAMSNLIAKGNALNAAINKHRTSKEVAQFQLAIRTFANTGWNGAKTVAKDTVNCLTKYGEKVGPATTTFFKRFKTLVNRKAQIAANSIPAPVKNQLKKLISDLTKISGQYGQLASAVDTASGAFDQLGSSQTQAVSAIVPIPKQNAVQKVQLVISKYNTLKQKLNAVEGKASALRTSQQQFVNDLVQLDNELRKLDGELKNEASKLAFTAFDISLLSQQSQGLTNVINKWEIAKQKFPERLASLATGGLSDQVIAQVEQGIVQMNNLYADLGVCVTNAANKRNSIQSQQRKTQAINQTLAGLSADATATMVSLQSLLSPSLNMLSKISTTMNNAAQLSNRIQSIGNTASNNFVQSISNFERDLRTAGQCVTGKKSQILTKKTEMLRLLN